MFVALMYAFNLPCEYQRSLAARLNSIQANSERSTPQKHYFSASGTHFCWRLSKPQGLAWPEGIGKSKRNSCTSPDLEPTTFRQVAYCLNHYATACPRYE
jgi:hypothetical protein